MRFTPKRFRLNSAECSVLESTAKKYHLKKSSVLRLICLFGPEPSSLYPNENIPTIKNGLYSNDSLVSTILVEGISQAKNSEQARLGFEKFLRGVGIEDTTKEDIFADPERRPTIEAINNHLVLIASVIERVNTVSASINRNEISAKQSSLCRYSCVTARLENDFYNLLCLKAEAFGLCACDYLRLCLQYLPEIIEFEPLCLEVLDFNKLHARFRECGSALGDAVHYLNSEMLGYYKLNEIVLMLELRDFLEKLEIAVELYQEFCTEFDFMFKE